MLADLTKTIFRADEPRRTKEHQQRREQKDHGPERQLPVSSPRDRGLLAGGKQVVQKSKNFIMAHGVDDSIGAGAKDETAFREGFRALGSIFLLRAAKEVT